MTENLPSTDRRGKTTRRALSFVVAMACSQSLVGCPPATDELDPDSSVTIGLLLPYTGTDAATASNFEKAVLLAVERVNETDGIHGKPIRLIARDTHSEVERSLKAAEELLDEGSLAIIGPESPEIVQAILPALNEAEVPLISPLIGEGEELELDCTYPWYRLAPSAQALAENLANDLVDQGISTISILYGSGEYNDAFRRAVRAKFESPVLGGSVLIERGLEESASSHAEEIESALEPEPDAIILSTSPQTGARVFTEATLLDQGNTDWALSPLLKTPLFLQNINPEQAEGAIGVAPKIFDSSDEFPNDFAERWLGDSPLEGAYFYYDAVNLLTLALASIDDMDEFSHESFTASMVQASSARGIAIGWDEVADGLERIADGTAVHYSGLTGPILLQDCGNRRSGTTQAWTIADGQIEEDD